MKQADAWSQQQSGKNLFENTTDTFNKVQENPELVDQIQTEIYNENQQKGEQFIKGIENGIQEGKEWLGLAEPSIKDETNTNIETQLGSNVITDTGNTNGNNGNNAQDTLKELWAREDEIRKETQAREDTAYQRAVEDMVKAGINPNLIPVNPAQSGGGVTAATGIEQAGYGTDVSAMIDLLSQEIENAFEGKENQKDRFNQILSSVLMALIFKSK